MVVPRALAIGASWSRAIRRWPVSIRLSTGGSATGPGPLALAQGWDGAAVTALDISAELLGRLSDKARDLGLADRIPPVQADLDAAWPAVDAVDLVWASNSLHHMADP